MIGVCALAFLLTGCPETGADNIVAPIDATSCILGRIKDGDTIVCTDGRTVRLLSVDAPESAQRLGPQATAALAQMVPLGASLRLELDTRLTDSGDRTLAWVWLGNVLINRQLALEGYVALLIVPPNTLHSSAVRAAVIDALNSDRGLWAQNFAACLPVNFRAGLCRD